VYSMPLFARMNGLDFLLSKRQSHDNACSLQNFVASDTLHDAKVYGNILQIRETGFTSRAPMFEKS
jgi:hypothetical protein